MCITTVSTFFGVTDIGMATMLGTNAFDMLIIRGLLFLLGGIHTRLDWYQSGRDTIFLVVVLVAVSMMLLKNKLEVWNSLIMLLLYLVYIVFIKFNSTIEPKIKKFVELKKKFKLAPRLEYEEIKKKHRTNKDVLRRYTPKALIEEQKYFQYDSHSITLTFNNEKSNVFNIPLAYTEKDIRCRKIVEKINFILLAIWATKKRLRHEHLQSCITLEKSTEKPNAQIFQGIAIMRWQAQRGK